MFWARPLSAPPLTTAARIAGLRDFSTPTLEGVELRRLQLWTLTLGLFFTSVATLVVLMLFAERLLPTWLEPGVLRGALVILVALFCVYAVEKEFQLRSLSRRLVAEQILTASLTQRLKELGALLEAGRAVNLDLRLEEVVQTILRCARELLEARDSSIQLVSGPDELKTVSVEGDSAAIGARIRIGEGVAGRVAATGEPVLVEGRIDDPTRRPQTAPPTSAMSVPLTHRGTLLGVMNINAPPGRSYSSHDLRALALFGEQAASAIANAQLYENQRLQAHRHTYQAFHDPLTGLPNRSLFFDRLGHALGRRRELGSRLAVLLVDLDDFKRVNDALGHQAGDELLAAVSERLRSAVRTGDTVARLAGDEFALLAEPIRDAAEAVAAAHRVLQRLETPVRVAGRDLRVGASVGIALESGPALAGDLVREADLALRAAKLAGKQAVVVFGPEHAAQGVERLDLEHDLTVAMTDHQLVVHFQPIVRLGEGTVASAEALIRWNHPRRGLLTAGAFVPLAEQMGLLSAIDRTVIDEALALAQRADRDLGLPLRVAANFSPSRLREASVVDEIGAALDRFRLPPGRLVLEITESAILRDVHAAATRLGALRALGISLALDDFGTGYSSLTHLQRFPVDSVKIDRSFVSGLDDDPSGRDLLEGVLKLARGLGLEVVAEGVENTAQAEVLRELGCPLAQGFLFGRPAPAAELIERLGR